MNKSPAAKVREEKICVVVVVVEIKTAFEDQNYLGVTKQDPQRGRRHHLTKSGGKGRVKMRLFELPFAPGC